jgi:hypothetical protein
MRINIDIGTYMFHAVKPKAYCTNSGTHYICNHREDGEILYLRRSVGIFRKTETGFRPITHIPLSKRRYFCDPCTDTYIFNNR